MLPTLQELPSVLVRVLMPSTLLLLVTIRMVDASNGPNLESVALAPGPTVRQTMQLSVWFKVVVRLVRTSWTTRSRPLLLVYRSLSAMWAAARIPKCPVMMELMARLQSPPIVFLVMILVLSPLPNMRQLVLEKTRGASGSRDVTASALPVPPMTLAVMSMGSPTRLAPTVTTVRFPGWLDHPLRSRRTHESLLVLPPPPRREGEFARPPISGGPDVGRNVVCRRLVRVLSLLPSLLWSSLVGMLPLPVILDIYLVRRPLVVVLLTRPCNVVPDLPSPLTLSPLVPLTLLSPTVPDPSLLQLPHPLCLPVNSPLMTRLIRLRANDPGLLLLLSLLELFLLLLLLTRWTWVGNWNSPNTSRLPPSPFADLSLIVLWRVARLLYVTWCTAVVNSNGRLSGGRRTCIRVVAKCLSHSWACLLVLVTY